jgi:hypothetical protein
MTALIDMTGRTIGRLLVLGRGPNYRTQARWWCRCSCGRKKLVHGASLRNGESQSCGCYMKEQNSAEARARRRAAHKR